MANDLEKAAAARASLRFVHDGNIVGLGTGSTAAYAVRFLGELVREGLKIRGIPTSVQTGDLAASAGIPLTTLDEIQQLGLQPIDVTIDGADEFDAQLRLIKGGGGALLREKIIGPLALGTAYPELTKRALVCVTETTTRPEIERFAGALKRALERPV